MAIAIDTETTLISEAEPVPRLVSVAIAGLSGCALLAAHDPAVPRVVVHVLETGAIFANAPFDVYALCRRYPELWPAFLDAYEHGRVHDVLLRERYIDIAEGEFYQRGKYDLGSVAKRRAGIEIDKNDPWRLRYEELLGLEISAWPAEARAYAEADAAATWATWYAQEQFRGEYDIDVFADTADKTRRQLALYAQELVGMHTDPARVAALAARLQSETIEVATRLARAGLVRLGGTKKNPKIVRSPANARALAEQLDLPVDRTAKGDISLSASSLAAARLPKDHPLTDYRRYGVLMALQSKNLPPLRAPVVRTRYEPLVDSGRVSSSAPRFGPGTNLQNLPQAGGFRECLVPPPGCKFIISDWGGAELVTLAQVQIDMFGRSALADALRAGRDPHSDFAARLLGLEEIDRTNPNHEKMRKLAKAWNFGKPGGMGDRKFVQFLAMQGLYLTEAEVKGYTKLWLEQWPEMRLYFQAIAAMEGPYGWITIIQPRSGRIRGGCTFTQACNTNFQGLAADAASTALWWLFRAGHDPASPLYGCYQCLFVHDENVTVAPAERAEVAKAEQERLMVAAFAQWCPDVPIKVDSKITDCYSK